MTQFQVPLIIRGEVIEGADVEFGGRTGLVTFTTPDVKKYLDRLPLSPPSKLGELQKLSFDDVLDYLEELGAALDITRNKHMQQAYELSCLTSSGLSPGILRFTYENVGRVFDRDEMRQMADILIGTRFLDGWVETRTAPGYKIAVRAFGARTVHIPAGNVPTVAAITILRNAIIRSDAIIKTPSNDPLTAAAIARTMIDMAPNHPLTKSVSVAYWKGGDASVEDVLYKPKNVEKIVAWGGLASVSHIAKYIQPGIDLITLDPKLSSTIIGPEAFADEATMQDVAARVALDVGVFNQEGCLNARVIYAQTGTDKAGVETANRFGKMVYDAIQTVPSYLSGPARQLNADLAEELEGLRYSGGLYKMIGGDAKGGVIVSQSDEPVEFSPLLYNRVCNIVPVDDLEIPIRAVTAYTQTIGIYPDSLVPQIRDRLVFQGAQRFTSLGYATRRVVAGPSDGIEPMRRMCKWIMHETYDAQVEPPLPAATVEANEDALVS